MNKAVSFLVLLGMFCFSFSLRQLNNNTDANNNLNVNNNSNMNTNMNTNMGNNMNNNTNIPATNTNNNMNNNMNNNLNNTTPALTASNAVSSGTHCNVNIQCCTIDNCRNYQQTGNFSTFGCGVCEKGFMLTSDEFGVGVCNQPVKIQNCLGSQMRSQSTSSTPTQAYCWDCDVGFVLSQDGKTCGNLSANFTAVDHCKSYWTNSQGKVLCNSCLDGFTLTEQYTCKQGCNMKGCSSCMTYQGKNVCWLCNEGLIGIYDPRLYGYVNCFTCNEWFQNLMTKVQ